MHHVRAKVAFEGAECTYPFAQGPGTERRLAQSGELHSRAAHLIGDRVRHTVGKSDLMAATTHAHRIGRHEPLRATHS